MIDCYKTINIHGEVFEGGLRLIKRKVDKFKENIFKSRFALLFTDINKYGNIVPNINLNLSKKQKKVLIVYVDYKDACIQIANFYNENSNGTLHTNRLELFQIIKAFIGLDYCVDVCAYDDYKAKAYIAKNNYDIIFGLGDMFRWACKHIKAYKIIYMTENPYDISLEKETERITYFEQRHKKRWFLERTNKFYHKQDENRADMVISVGETEFYKDRKIEAAKLYPSGLFNDAFCFNSNNKDKTNFLVFGTDGFIHKGNDLLIDVFLRHPEWTLYICGSNVTSSIKKIMGINIEKTNIIDCGYINVSDKKYLELVYKCVFVLQPSCSEASSTAILTCMRHGMIPIVMHGNGFDRVDKYCYFFENYFIDDIEQTIKDAIAIENDSLLKRSREVYLYANKAFTIEAFGKEIEKILMDVC